jgi:hypothetical protein
MGCTIDDLWFAEIPTFFRTEVLAGPFKPNAEAQQKVARRRVMEATFMVKIKVNQKIVRLDRSLLAVGSGC